MNKNHAQELIMLAMGEASMAWAPTPTGMFLSEVAEGIGMRLTQQLYEGSVVQGRRDYFAAEAMKAFISEITPDTVNNDLPANLAGMAVTMADAIIAHLDGE